MLGPSWTHTQHSHSPSNSLLELDGFHVLGGRQFERAERGGRGRGLQGLDGLRHHMVLGDGQHGPRVVLQLLGAARGRRGRFPVRQVRARRPLDHRGHRGRFLGDTGSAYEGLVALGQRRGQRGLRRLLRGAGDHGDGDDRDGRCQRRGRQRHRARRGDGHQHFAPGLLRGKGAVGSGRAGLARLLLLLLPLPLQAQLLMLLILL